MKILPVQLSPLKFSKCVPKRQNQEYKTNSLNLDYSCAPIFCSKSFKYRPIALKKPSYELLNCNYHSLDEFSKLFSEKINSQMYCTEISDIDALITRIKIKSGADEKTIKDVLYQLTMFSNYDTINVFQKIADNAQTNAFGVQMKWKQPEVDISSNGVLNYFSKNKDFIKCEDKYPTNSIVVLDNLFIEQLENAKKQNSDYYKRFVEDLNDGYVTLLNIKGWNIKCSDDKYRSSAFIYGTGNLESLALDVIKRLKRGEDIDEILYSDNEEKLKDILKDDVAEDKINVTRVARPFKKDISKEDIFKNISIPKLEAENVSRIFKKMYEPFENVPEYKKTGLSILMQFIDEASVAYSFDTIALGIKKMYEEIKEEYGDNVVYLIMDINKSSSLMNHLFAHFNNISADKFYNLKFESKYFNKIKQDGVATTIVDDVTASGKTISNYTRHLKFVKTPLEFRLLTASDCALENYKDCPYKPGEIKYLKNIKDIKCYKGKKLDIKELRILNNLLFSGYNDTGLSVVYPYIIPDNCSNLSGELFDNLLIKSTSKSNKARLEAKTYA